FYPWRGAPSRVAQRAMLFCFSSFLLEAARRAWVGGATRSLELFRMVFLLLVARRAVVIGAQSYSILGILAYGSC
ncbi:hypothetical protein A2U01_0067247, partial [Trifolium medium]|nr:hypothetical protein [Trifolium medium]